MANNKQVVKKKKGKAFKIAVSVFLILAVAGFLVISLMYNLFSVRDSLLKTAYSMDPDFVAAGQLRDQLAQKETELADRESKVSAEEQRLAELKKKLDERKKELDQRERESIPIYRRPMTEDELGDMKSIGKIYAEMQPEDAAAILISLYSTEDMAAVLYHMSEKSSAAILSAMDTTVAAEITDMLLHE